MLVDMLQIAQTSLVGTSNKTDVLLTWISEEH